VYFAKVSSESPFFSKSQFWAGLSDSYLRDFTKAEKYFKAIDSKDSLNRSLQTFELAGLALLQRNQQRFDSCTSISIPIFMLYKNNKPIICFTEMIF
jgi:hypothetical protein